jgi:hypothetical protein
MIQQQIIPKEIISEGIGEIYYLLPIPFIALVLMASIWLGIINLDGTKVKLYKLYNAIIAISYAVMAHFFIPVDERKINDIPTLVISIVASGVFVEIFLYWRKNKSKKK